MAVILKQPITLKELNEHKDLHFAALNESTNGLELITKPITLTKEPIRRKLFDKASVKAINDEQENANATTSSNPKSNNIIK